MTIRGDVLVSDMSLISDDAKEDHPAWKAFQKEMKGRQYGRGPLNSAWSWFKVGWQEASREKT